MKKIGALLIVIGIIGNTIFLQMKIEGIIHDITRLSAISGIVLVIIGFFKKKKIEPNK